MFNLFKKKKQLGEDYPIKIGNYSKYYVIYGSNEDYILKYMEEYTEILKGEKQVYTFKYYTVIQDKYHNCIIFKCPDDMDFYNYCNLSTYIYGDKSSDEGPVLTAIVSLSKRDESENYYATLEIGNRCRDTMIAVVNNGTKFSIYIPKAFENKGTICGDNGACKFTKVEDFLKNYDLKIEDLTLIDEKDFNTITLEMVV